MITKINPSNFKITKCDGYVCYTMDLTGLEFVSVDGVSSKSSKYFGLNVIPFNLISRQITVMFNMHGENKCCEELAGIVIDAGQDARDLGIAIAHELTHNFHLDFSRFDWKSLPKGLPKRRKAYDIGETEALYVSHMSYVVYDMFDDYIAKQKKETKQ